MLIILLVTTFGVLSICKSLLEQKKLSKLTEIARETSRFKKYLASIPNQPIKKTAQKSRIKNKSSIKKEEPIEKQQMPEETPKSPLIEPENHPNDWHEVIAKGARQSSKRKSPSESPKSSGIKQFQFETQNYQDSTTQIPPSSGQIKIDQKQQSDAIYKSQEKWTSITSKRQGDKFQKQPNFKSHKYQANWSQGPYQKQMINPKPQFIYVAKDYSSVCADQENKIVFTLLGLQKEKRIHLYQLDKIILNESIDLICIDYNIVKEAKLDYKLFSQITSLIPRILQETEFKKLENIKRQCKLFNETYQERLILLKEGKFREYVSDLKLSLVFLEEIFDEALNCSYERLKIQAKYFYYAIKNEESWLQKKVYLAYQEGLNRVGNLEKDYCELDNEVFDIWKRELLPSSVLNLQISPLIVLFQIQN